MWSLLLNTIERTKGLDLYTLEKSTIRVGGSTDVELQDGVKSPDSSLYEKHPTEKLLAQAWPTVVLEVAYGEDEKKLAYDLGRYVACSLGNVQLAIGVNMERNRAEVGQPQSLKKVTCAFWEADYVEAFTTLEKSGAKSLNQLTRCDDFADKADDYVVPAATKFSCVSKFDGKYIKFVVSQQALYTVSTCSLECLLTR